MPKKYLTIAISFVLVTCLIYALLHFSNLKNFKNNHAIKAIPTDASVIIQLQHPDNVIDIVLNDINYKEPLMSFEFLKQFNRYLTKLNNDSIFNTKLIKSLKNKPITISLHPIGKDNVVPLFTYSLNNKAEQNKIATFFDDGTRSQWTINKRKYNTSYIYSLGLKKEKGKIFISLYRGLLIASNSSLVVENSLRQLRTDFSLMEDKTFHKLYKTVGNNADANIFINFSRLPETLSSLFLRKAKQNLSFFKNTANWAELDINLKDNHILINGFLYTADNETKLKTLFDGIDTNSSKINEVIPDNASFALSYSFDDNDKLRENLSFYLKQNNQYENYQNELNRINPKGNKNQIEESIFELIDNEFTLVVANSKKINTRDGKYLIVKTKSKSKTIKFIQNINNNKVEPTSYYKLDEQTKYPIYKTDKSEIIPLLLTTFCPNPPSAYYTFINNYLIYSNTQRELSEIIYANILNKTLDKSKYHEQFSKMFSYKENMFIYCDISKVKNLIPDASQFELLNPSKLQQEALNKFYGIGIQLATANDLLYLNACIEYLPQRESEPETVWQSGLDSTIIGKPNLVQNHYTKEKEILVQDKSNILYLISNSGRILWKKKVEGQIFGEITQIDYYRNNKLQYLFNTTNRIYLLDRNGNNVEKYPINLANKATNPISVFDYDNNRNYRIFVACSNNKTYAFDKTGKKITGWNAKPTEGKVRQAIQHFRVQGKDYIVMADDKRNYILNRKGEERVKIQSDFISNIYSQFYIIAQNNIPYLSITDTKGNLQQIDLKTGKCTSKTLLNSDEGHHFIAYNISEEEGLESIITTQNKVMAFKVNGKKLFEVEISGNILPVTDCYQFTSKNKKIGVFDAENNKIYLINNDGSIYKNFPLRGKSRFSIGFLNNKSSKFNLIVGGENNYLYNYKVE